VLFDLDTLCARRKSPPYNKNRLPFESHTFDEVHAYEVLEHIGTQGVVESFFWPFAEIHRVLKPGGYLAGTCPNVISRWAWGDPGHRRIIGPEQLVFLDQTEYQKQVGVTPMTDYRGIWTHDFERVAQSIDAETFVFVLRAHKPSRC
jgi:SAM-dependent methyltransferase